MLEAVLVAVSLLMPGAAAGPRPEDLIARLGAPRYAEREAAAAGLEKLGRLALPALLARRDHRDPEVRTRVVALIGKIEGSLLLEATPVPLDFDDRPLGEVVAAIAERSDLAVALAPGAPPTRRVTLRAPGPVPFWSAVDRLADLADLGYAFPVQAIPNQRDHPLTLAPTAPRPPGIMWDHGPFRVNLMSLHYQRDLSFTGRNGSAANGIPVAGPAMGDGPGATVSVVDGRSVLEQFYLKLQLAAEPRLALRPLGGLRLSAAVDDLGQSLLPTSPPPDVRTMAVHPMMSSPLPFQAALRRPESPGRTIRLIRGTISASVASRRPGPLVVALEGAAGKTFRNEDATLVVNEARPPAPNVVQVQIDLTITSHPSRPSAAPEPAAELDPFLQRPDLGPLQLEVADAAGRLISWYPINAHQAGDELRLTLAATPGQAGPPATLRYYDTIQTVADIPFEFRDVPMP